MTILFFYKESSVSFQQEKNSTFIQYKLKYLVDIFSFKTQYYPRGYYSKEEMLVSIERHGPPVYSCLHNKFPWNGMDFK